MMLLLMALLLWPSAGKAMRPEITERRRSSNLAVNGSTNQILNTNLAASNPIQMPLSPAATAPQNPAVTSNLPSDLLPYLKQMSHDFALHVVNTFSPEMEKVRNVIVHEDQLGSARHLAFLISGLSNDGKETVIRALAHILNRPCLVVDSDEMIKAHKENAFAKLTELLTSARSVQEKTFFVCKRLDKLDRAYQEQWKSKFSENPTLQLWQAMKTASAATPQNRLLSFCTVDCEYPLSIAVGNAEKNISLSAVLAQQELIEGDICGTGPSTDQQKRVLQALCYYLKRDGYSIKQKAYPSDIINGSGDIVYLAMCLRNQRLGNIQTFFEDLKRFIAMSNPDQKTIACKDIRAQYEEEEKYRRSRLSCWEIKAEQAKVAATVTGYLALAIVGWVVASPIILPTLIISEVTNNKIKKILEDEYQRLMGNSNPNQSASSRR